MTVTVKSNQLHGAAVRGVSFMDKLIRAEAFSIERDMKKSMTGPKHGVIYIRGKRKHQASAPGEPPARDTGSLANSMHVLTNVQPHTVFVMIDGENAAHLEYGTVNMAPRPFVAPAVEKSKVRLSQMKLPAEVLVRGVQ